MKINRLWRAVPALVIAALLLLLSACSSSDDNTDSSSASSASAGEFPVTVTHAFGETTIEEDPERVVALIDRDADTLLALGVTPVAIRSLYEFESGVGPWAEEALGDAKPTVWTGQDLNYESIAAADPDLIVFATSGGDEEEYKLLSAIAPTIPLPEGAEPWAATTEQTTLLIAEALGRKADGEQLLAGMDAYLAEQKAAYPAFAGKTANYLDIYDGGMMAYGSRHIVNGLLYSVGFEPIPAIATVDELGIKISPETLGNYDADVVVSYTWNATLEDLKAKIPTFASLGSVTNGQFFVLQDLAFSNSSVLSIQYALDNLLPQINQTLA
ncbi:iron-siderophore ABC transporter substrate-binding protein [Williamsia sp.]|uniref:iron-siderophore ABC transporter substrate-binding protein n=1 Tax=Williamsia sp. TaxID=1872085 RepID=UPI002F95F8A0